MNFKPVIIIFSLSLFFSCASQNDLVINSIKTNLFTEMVNRTLVLTSLTFDDWAYPELAKMKELFPEDEELWDFSYEAGKYHGVKIVIDDFKNMTYTYDETDDTYLYNEPDQYKVIAFFPRNNMTLEKLFKYLYSSKSDFRLEGDFLYVLPEEVWTDIQVHEPDMPVLIIKTVNKSVK